MNGCMLTPEETAALQALLRREAHRPPTADPIQPGDVVQLRPGTDRTWETSLLLVCQANSHQVRGPILRPHRGGCREAWAKYSAAEVVRIGPAPFGEPAPDIRSWCYEPPCPTRETGFASYRDRHQAARLALRAEQIDLERKTAQRSRQAAARALLKKTKET